MNKKVLIISPYFPPVNAADMQRIRMSLSWYAKFGWDATVITVNQKYADLPCDKLLLQSIPNNVRVIKIKAFNKNITSVIGLGAIALRSLWFYRQKINSILKNEKFDLIFFSTTQFPVCVLGAYWKKRFKIPYVIDMQDPWYSTAYNHKSLKQRGIYFLHKIFEAVSIKNADGLISVSEKYITQLIERYPAISNIPAAVIPFGVFEPDLEIASTNEYLFKPLLNPEFKNIVYIGRGGTDMHKALSTVFKSFADNLNNGNERLRTIKFHFIGTSYAPNGTGKQTIYPLAKEFGIEKYVSETTGRISYYHTLSVLQQADALFIPGSDDAGYTASKIFPYILTRKLMLAVFNAESSSVSILKKIGIKHVYSFNQTKDIHQKINNFFTEVLDGNIPSQLYNTDMISEYSSSRMTVLQCELFDQVISLAL